MVQSIYSSSSPVNLSDIIFSFSAKVLFRTAFGGCKWSEQQFKSPWSSVNELISLSITPKLAHLFPSLEFVHVISGLKAHILKMYEEAYKLVDTIINESSGGDNEDSITLNDIKAIIMVSNLFNFFFLILFSV